MFSNKEITKPSGIPLPRKGMVSEPVLTLIKLFNQNPRDFKEVGHESVDTPPWTGGYNEKYTPCKITLIHKPTDIKLCVSRKGLSSSRWYYGGTLNEVNLTKQECEFLMECAVKYLQDRTKYVNQLLAKRKTRKDEVGKVRLTQRLAEFLK